MNIERLLYSAPAVLIAMVLHELSHAYVSYRLGDPTPKQTGRLTLNPLKHLDPIGSICLLVLGFGWAKPVQINPNYYKNPKIGTLWVSLAGPAMNFLLAFIGSLGVSLIYKITGDSISFQTEAGYRAFLYIFRFLYYFMLINIGLGVFNLIPFPPLDGSKVLATILPDRLYYTWMRYERYGQFILMVLLYAGLLSTPLAYLRSGVFNGMQAVTNFLLQV